MWKTSKYLDMSKEMVIRIYEILQILLVCPGKERLPRNYFKFQRVEKNVVGQNTELSSSPIKFWNNAY